MDCAAPDGKGLTHAPCDDVRQRRSFAIFPRNGASIAETSVFSEKGNGTSLLEAPGDAIFRDYILTRSWRQWYGDDVEGMNVWMEPVTKEMNFQYKEYTKDRPIVRL